MSCPRFILARLYMDLLKDQLRLHDVESTLESFRRSESKSKVADAYAATVYRINAKPESYRKLARQVLMWMTFARRPMSTAEMKHALAIHCMGQDILDKNYFYPTDHILTACQGLIDVEESSNILRWSHPTAQAYLQQNIFQIDPEGTSSLSRPGSGRRALSSKPSRDAHRDMTLVCITYLSLERFQKMDPSQLVKESSRKDNMLGYAAVHWGRHAELGWPFDSPERRFLIDFVKSHKLAMAYRDFWRKRRTRHHCYLVQPSLGIQMDPVMLRVEGLAADLRLQQVVVELLRNSNDPDDRDQHGVQLLSRAQRTGELEIVAYKRGSPFLGLPIAGPQSVCWPSYTYMMEGRRYLEISLAHNRYLSY